MQTMAGAPLGPVGARLRPAGVEWDAIRVPRYIGLSTLQRVSDLNLHVIVDPAERVLYFLVPVGVADDWELSEARVLGAMQYIVVPPMQQQAPPGPYWLMSGTWPPCLGKPRLLRTALEDACNDHAGPTAPHLGIPGGRVFAGDGGRPWASGVQLVTLDQAPLGAFRTVVGDDVHTGNVNVATAERLAEGSS